MSRSALLLVFACMIFGSASPAAAADVPLPTGSYLESCKVASFDPATGELAADCEGPAVGMFGHGTPDTSHLNVKGCKEGTIWNDQRQLYCLAAEAWGNDRIIPPGSYIETCTGRRVFGGALLQAECGIPTGGSYNASLDLRTCTWGKDIYNHNGNLGCSGPMATAVVGRMSDQAVTSDQPLVKPVSIDPGPVKPVAIAPLGPSTSPTADDRAERRKNRKKNRLDRGERG